MPYFGQTTFAEIVSSYKGGTLLRVEMFDGLRSISHEVDDLAVEIESIREEMTIPRTAEHSEEPLVLALLRDTLQVAWAAVEGGHPLDTRHHRMNFIKLLAKTALPVMSVWKHIGTGGIYAIQVPFSYNEADMKPVVVYRSLADSFVRPLIDFISATPRYTRIII